MANTITQNQSDFTVTDSGEAFISIRKAADLLGVSHTAIQNHVSSCHPNYLKDNGLSAEMLQQVATHYALFSKAANDTARNFAAQLMEAGAKAYIYAQAGYRITATPMVHQELSVVREDLIMLAAWERKRDLYIAAVEAEHKIIMADIAQRSAALEAREFVLIDGMLVKTAMEASKVVVPVISVTALVAGSKITPAQANIVLQSLGYLERHSGVGSPWKVTTAGLYYGRNTKASKSAVGTVPGWFEGTNLLEVILAKFNS